MLHDRLNTRDLTRAALRACLGLAMPVLGATSAAAADCPLPHPVRVCTEFFDAQYVVAGKVVSMKQWPQPPDPNNVEGWFFKVQIDRAFKGASAGQTVEFYTGNDPTGFPIKEGESYLLFVKKNDEGRLAPNNCGNSASLNQAFDSMKSLDQVQQSIATNADGNIGGQIYFAQMGSHTLSQKPAFGVVVIAKDTTSNASFRSLTDSEGKFNVSVPPGTYNVEGEPLSQAIQGIDEVSKITPYPLSYQKPTDVKISAGSCADMELLAEPSLAPSHPQVQ